MCKCYCMRISLSAIPKISAGTVCSFYLAIPGQLEYEIKRNFTYIGPLCNFLHSILHGKMTC